MWVTNLAAMLMGCIQWVFVLSAQTNNSGVLDIYTTTPTRETMCTETRESDGKPAFILLFFAVVATFLVVQAVLTAVVSVAYGVYVMCNGTLSAYQSLSDKIAEQKKSKRPYMYKKRC
jgi:hypothetical protein